MTNGSASPPPRRIDGAPFDLDRVVGELRATRRRWRESQQRNPEAGGRELPSLDVLRGLMASLRGALFPMRLGPPELRQETEDFYVGHTLDAALSSLCEQVRLEFRHAARGTQGDGADADALAVVRAFAGELPAIRARLDTDVLAAFHGDPAAHSVDEVLLCYPGVLAMTHHRIAHALSRLGAPLIARIVAELAHTQTGIDIHPAAQIDEGFFIDHGTGVVIGETTIIGKCVRLYQAVTLGAKHFPADPSGTLRKGLPRHPIIDDDVVIYAGATVLGRVTIGRGSTIGGNVWLTHSVPPGSHVTQATLRQQPAQDTPARQNDVGSF